MTSEPSQQPEDNAHQRAFGLFDAPPAPEEFPVFTPYQPSSDNEADAFPPDSDSGQPAPFSGFPSDDSGLPEWSSSADAYVPAPAVMPIPGVRHDMDPPPSSSGWSTASESYEPDPYSHPSDPNPYGQPPEPSSYGSESGLYGQAPEPEVDESPAGTWSAFAAGDAPKLAPAPTPWTEAAGYEPASSFDGPSTWDQPESVPVAFQEPEPISPPPPIVPAAAPPPPSATGSVRVAAAVPASNRLSPEEAAPAVIPRPAGRVYGSAAAAAPADAPPAPAFDPAPIPVDPQPAARATARAAVSVARPEPGEAPPPATRSSTVYGSPVSPEAPQMAQAAPAPVLPQRPGRQHTFGDLLGPAAPSAPEGPPVLAAPAPAVPAQRMPAPAGPPPGAPYGAPPPGLGGNVPPAAAQRPSAAVPPNRHPNQAMADQFAKPSTTTGSLPTEPKPERKGRIIIGVLIGCVALLAVAFGGLILIDKLFNGPVFVVGDCVKQNDGIAIKAECTESGAFEVKAAVSSPEQCQDQVQPHVQQKDQILCLAPAGPPISANPTTTPQPTATSTPTTQ